MIRSENIHISVPNTFSVSEVRIVLLGEDVPLTNRVGNFILGRSAFETEVPLTSVKLHSERASGHVEGRIITIINTPHLFNPKLSQEEVTRRVKECLSLTDPGPHVFLLVLQSKLIPHELRDRVRSILHTYNPLSRKRSIMLSTGEGHGFIHECDVRHHRIENMSTFDQHEVLKLLGKIDAVVKETGGSDLPEKKTQGRHQSQLPGNTAETDGDTVGGKLEENKGKGRELADMMERRKVDILCVQETRWKGSKARSIGAGFKLFYYGVDSKRNGVGVVLKEEFVRNVLEVKRVSDRVMSLKLEIEGVMLNVVSGYAPQVGCELEEKERFWSELDEVMESIPTGERVVIGADFNGHVGEGNTGDEEVMGKFGVKERNFEGQMVVDFAKRMDMGVVNTYFQKREEHRVTYKSGGRRTQVDYILCRRGNLKEISDCKVVVGESVARQHRMVVCRMTLMVCKTKRSKIEIEKKTKWWKLKKEECCEEFRQKLRQALGGQVVLPDDWETTAEVIRETGRKVLGVSSGRRKEDKETWWWNEEVQDSIQRKRLAKKKWDMDRTEENRQEYKELQRRVKREVSKAKQKAYDELYTRLDTREGEKDLYRLARQRDRDGKDVQQVRVIKDRDGRVLTSEESVQRRWKEYFEELMNEENEREKRVEGVNSVEQKVDKIRKDEVRKALMRTKSGKAVGPDNIPVEVWKCLGEAAVEFLASLFNRVLESERMPEEWRRSVLVPIFKNKGDVQSCSNYRGIKLMSHTMKLWERVVEARLRKVVEICEQQYGFMPRKSTTDAIFALRILMEKYRDGQRELHCVFVDLEKAYDRVPREELWYCMRKSGVAGKYVRVVQDMYERSRTVVRCAVGQTVEFNVEVGLHQGSALSPFLFAIVMDQLSEEVRQESPWTMMFADDIVICSESREQVEENLERWRFALERRGMKVSHSKTEYMCVNEREGSGTVRLQGEEVKKVQEFKYLGSTVQSNGECGKEVKKRVQAGWNGWRKVSGVLCDQKISARIKGKVYRTVVRPAMLYGLETVSLRKRQESELEVAELKMLRFSLGVTRLDRIRNEYIRGTAHVGRLGDKVREARLRWFGHVQRREKGHGDTGTVKMGFIEQPEKAGRVKMSEGDGVRCDWVSVEPGVSVTLPPLHGPLLRTVDPDIVVVDPCHVELDRIPPSQPNTPGNHHGAGSPRCPAPDKPLHRPRSVEGGVPWLCQALWREEQRDEPVVHCRDIRWLLIPGEQWWLVAEYALEGNKTRGGLTERVLGVLGPTQKLVPGVLVAVTEAQAGKLVDKTWRIDPLPPIHRCNRWRLEDPL
ncbi:hypothetical protein QTP86_033482 [Hemibagrus guttatus]|nr:hypothetical protein QTP86_033482 [Hemibagrus guttatus]